MEPLLSLSFSNISSRDAPKIRKGLRQIEGLLAQICLSAAPKSVETKASIYHLHDSTQCKRLLDLGDDPAFCEFFRLQDGFECNGKSAIMMQL
jgi:Cell division control protein 14, SIN component